MDFRQAIAALAACLTLIAAEAHSAVPVEIASHAPPHGTAPRQWLQRLSDAGAGSTRLVGASGREKPRLDELGEGRDGRPIVKVYAVLTRKNELLLPGARGHERYRLSDQKKLAEFFQRLEAGGAEGVTAPRGKHDLTEAEFTDAFTRLQRPLPSPADGATLQELIDEAARVTRLKIEADAPLRPVLATRVEDAASLDRLACGTALAAALRAEGLALTPDKPIGGAMRLRIVASKDAAEPWPVGYKPERSPRETAPILMDFLTIEIDGYTLAEALGAIRPRLVWKDKPLPIVWDRFAMRSAGIDPAAVPVTFKRKRTFYKKVVDKLAFQARLKLDLRVDEAGTPFLWLTR
ncbi:hypothetical protein MalM25_32670 [Planctomycetes bacterium MalM25]|nr:hypothetical protein MalM25_32670 [Planctomycetes bacterium MalM25]